jgi:hypothetical protein
VTAETLVISNGAGVKGLGTSDPSLVLATVVMVDVSVTKQARLGAGESLVASHAHHQ